MVILAGGKGTRFWPLGRESTPKQMLALDGDDPRPLLRATWERVRPVCEKRGPWVVAPKALGRQIRKILPEVRKDRLILEPEAKGTAAAVLTVAWRIGVDRPGTSVVVVPADQHVAPVPAYRRALAAMHDRALRKHLIVTLGIRPTHPATGYGYLEVGKTLERTPAGRIRGVVRFVEKPDAKRAAAFVRGGRHLWNGGTFAFRPANMVLSFLAHATEYVAGLRALLARKGAWEERIERAYAAYPAANSLDYAVMEKEKHVETLEVDFEWDDLGSFDAVHRHAAKDRLGNALPAGSVALDAKRCFVRSEDGTQVALVGVSDLVVVRTEDALLVAKRGRGEDVRKVVERLKEAGRGDLLA